uniref:Uncharacterized protein n=1 Tax=Amphimedon queenslandica TaxID=400682 RepID=A0A1X7U2P2_AMPQE
LFMENLKTIIQVNTITFEIKKGELLSYTPGQEITPPQPSKPKEHSMETSAATSRSVSRHLGPAKRKQSASDLQL